jgi:hypothetical protein
MVLLHNNKKVWAITWIFHSEMEAEAHRWATTVYMKFLWILIHMKIVLVKDLNLVKYMHSKLAYDNKEQILIFRSYFCKVSTIFLLMKQLNFYPTHAV